MKKRTAALAFLGLVLALVAATLLVLRTRWAADRICGLAAARLEAASGLPVAFRACRVDPLALELRADGVRLGPPEAPLLSADAIVARLALIQALGRQVHLSQVRLVRPRLAVTVAGSGGGGTCPPEVLSRIEIRRIDVEEGSLDLSVRGGVRLRVARLDVRSRPVPRVLRALPVPRRAARLEVDAAGVRLDGLDRPMTASRIGARADVALDLSRFDVAEAQAEIEGVRFTVRGRVNDLCDPDLALSARAEGPFRDVLALARIAQGADADGAVTADADVEGPVRSPRVAGTIALSGARVAWFAPGDVRARVHLAGAALAIDRLEWPFPGGRVTGSGSVGFGKGVPLQAAVETEAVDLADVFERVGITGSWVTVKLDGKGRLAGTLGPPELAGAVSADFRELRSYTRSWRVAAGRDKPVVDVKRGRLQSGLRVNLDALSFEGARVSGGRGTSEIDAVARFGYEQGFHVRWRGQVDLSHLGKVAEIPWGGLADVDGTISAAPYGNPRIVGRARAEGLRFNDIDLGNGATDFTYGPDFLLHVVDAQGVRGQGRWRGEGVVDLEATPARVLSSTFEAKGRVRDLFDAVRDWVPRTRAFRDVMDGEVEVSGTSWGPATFLDGTFDARMATGTFLGRPFDSARAAGTFERGEVARIERAEIRRDTGVVRMSGWYGAVPPFPWNLDVSFSGVPLEHTGLPGGDWSGSASGSAALRGSLEHPDVRFAANGERVALRGLALGALQAAGTVKETRAVLTGSGEGLRFEADAELEGRIPFHARAEVALDDVARVLQGAAPAGLRAAVRGEATAEGELEALDLARAHVRLDEVQVGHADARVEASGPVVIDAARGRIELQPVTFTGPSTSLTLSGTRAATGELDVSAAGDLDLRLLAGLGPELKRPHGRIGLEAHVSGTADDPVLVGAGRVDDAGFQLKGSQILLSGLRGDLAFSQNRVLFENLSAAVNGGRATLSGEVELASFRPVRGRIEAALDEVPVSVPAWLPATLSGRVEAAGTPESALVTGRLHVVRARYTADAELEKGLLELRRRPPPPPRPYDKAGEWLRFDLQIAVDGDARVENDLVQGGVRGELALAGTLAAPGLVGTLSMAEGSRARFRGNEFALSHAVVDFTDRNRIAVALDVHGESQVRDYKIFMHAFGPLTDPQLTLTSSPPLTQPDIITLLSLGFTRRDAAVDSGVSGVATAAAAQALFSASGLDEQVRRFLPRGGVLRDFSVRITTEWSEAGQAEPRAEFESLLLRDRLKLRYQAPLSGARGQKAQAELRLGGHTAVQYQWDNDNPDVAMDHGVDLKLRWEWTDD